MKKYWDHAIDFDDYLQIAHQRLNNPQTEKDVEFKPYYELGIHRMDRTLKKFEADEEQIKNLVSKNFKGKILIISEAWCGDASASVPAIVEFFKGQNEVKIFLRDSDSSLIDQYLTNGTQSIPKVLILNENFEVINAWGPRPKHGHELLLKYKADPEHYTKDQFYNDLQVYYSRNRGKDTIQEIVELL
ncbi:thioredoxin family protein [Chryseobacterium sp.]|uniref:thioredoxin family protein n=1 Tax=Chryseobacterium sp. TaxID=1871047 RepID=UPI00388F438B